MERIGRICALGPRVRQQLADLKELHERGWVTVVKQQRDRVWLRRAVDLGQEMVKLIEFPLLNSPVEAINPVAGELSEVVGRDAVVPF
ncbi:Uncharacterised protein [Mycobacteroides abscessus subsp. massiliense]|nr:Uncharacterised protein [Mycobacteroides abscessus subsp. massiliense]